MEPLGLQQGIPKAQKPQGEGRWRGSWKTFASRQRHHVAMRGHERSDGVRKFKASLPGVPLECR